MQAEETPIVFSCKQNTLFGVIHHPSKSKKRGILSVVAGGPQYRGGCCRQLLNMARHLASNGTPVMRFDYRGIGDSDGDYQGFENMQDDLNIAIEEFFRHSPGLEEVILWGGCDAAAASMLHGPYNPKVSGMILGNPWVHSEETEAKVVLKHYYWQRVREKSFWLKLLKLRMNPLEKIRSFFQTVQTARASEKPIQKQDQANLPFPQRMLIGLQKFEGRVLLFMSGQSLVSKEFDELIASSKEWQEAINNTPLTRIDLPEADQAFSSMDQQKQVIQYANDWMLAWDKEHSL